ncbi:hypothetical protein [Halomicrococcus sp. NG-SE-24]|uniref:hypothetical protein n=1 Tax=Halomicrococcus sp. NG-SE-24 TaxID=3436928 RepID=UPI003D9536E4
MPDEDDRFGDVAEQLKQTEADRDDETDAVDDTTSSSEAVNKADQDPSSTEGQDDLDDSNDGGPAFSFDETDMHGFYVRDETWRQITRMRSSVTAACSMFDVSEFEGREFQDACLQVIADHGDEVALQILRERGIEADKEQVQEIVEMLSKRATE